MIDIIPREAKEADHANGQGKRFQFRFFSRFVSVGLLAVIALISIVVLINAVRKHVNLTAPLQAPGQTKTIISLPAVNHTPIPIASPPTMVLTPTSESAFTPMLLPPTPNLTVSPTATPSATPTVSEPTLTPTLFNSIPLIYTLHAGEFPYCIARRFNVDPNELLTLNRLANRKVFYTGMVLKIPQTGNLFPGNRTLQIRPTTYTVSRYNETSYAIACVFGDIYPETIAQANHISTDSILFVGQQLIIP
jgi:LysM repeat protein